jgi:ribonuclease T
MTEEMTDAMVDASERNAPTLANRFRGFLPVVVDVETGGFESDRHALLEIAAVILTMDNNGHLYPEDVVSAGVVPHPEMRVEQASLDFTGIDPADPAREALPERDALTHVFRRVRQAVRDHGCTRAVVVAHNAHFDLGFINAATARCEIKRNPFHPFSCFDTATLAGLAYGQTVLARACDAAGIEFNNRKAHSAAYDAEKTAELFCGIVNRWKELGGWG